MERQGIEVVVVEGVSIERAKFEIVGLTPLIVNKYNKAIKTAETPNGKGKVIKRKPTPQEQYERSMYISQDGKHCFPASGFKKGMVRAGTYTNNKKLNMTFLKGAFFVEGEADNGELCVLEHSHPVMRMDVVAPTQKSKIEVYRAEYEEWTTRFWVTYNSSVIDRETLGTLVMIAGFSSGVGEKRPERGYTNGKYQLEGILIKVKDV